MMHRSVSEPQHYPHAIRPVMSPMRQRQCSVSAEDTVLLRRKFEFQSPGVPAGLGVQAGMVSVRVEQGDADADDQGAALISKKYENQDTTTATDTPSGPWVPQDDDLGSYAGSATPTEEQRDLPSVSDEVLPMSVATPSMDSPPPRRPSTTASVASTALQEISQMLTQKARELAHLADTHHMNTTLTPTSHNDATPADGYLRAENEQLRERVRLLESQLASKERCATCATALPRVKRGLVELKKKLLEERVKVLTLREQWGGVCGDAGRGILDMVGKTETMYEEAARERKKLLRRLQEVKGTIRVVARVRPLLRGEKKSCVSTDSDTIWIEKPNGQGSSSFTFDAVIPPSASQAGVYEELRDIPSLILDGSNCCVLAYGQTGSGKTYTMLGEHGATASVLSGLYSEMQHRSDVGGYSYRLFVSISEVYNDGVWDLFTHKKIDTFQGEYFGSEKEVTNPTKDIASLLKTGERERACGESNFNVRSSRSHCAILARIEGIDRATSTGIHGQVYLVDLAGSERIPTTAITHQGTSQTFISPGALLKETQHINKSLSALGSVISALSQSHQHVPYRNSRLTNLLKPCLKKGSKVLMVANVSPAADSAVETLCTLQFATRANSVHLNESRSSSSAPRSPRPLPTARHRSANPLSSRQLRSRSAPNVWEC